MFSNPLPLDKAVKVRCLNRPIKIAYIIPYEESLQSHYIIDAVFSESYARWGGVKTLIIPSSKDAFLYPEHELWLEQYDPDIIYTYVELATQLIEKINCICCSGVFKQHQLREGAEPNTWHMYYPCLNINAVNSISALFKLRSDYEKYFFIMSSLPSEPTLITQIETPDGKFERFIADNFGSESHTSILARTRGELLKLLCLTPDDLKKPDIPALQSTNSLTEILAAITDGQALTHLQLANYYNDNYFLVNNNEWAANFNIFLGSTCLDRINFWNARHFINDKLGQMPILVLRKELIDDKTLLDQLGLFIKKRSNSNFTIVIRSLSLPINELHIFASALQQVAPKSLHVEVSKKYNAPVIILDEARLDYYRSNEEKYEFRMQEDCCDLRPVNPAHFDLIPHSFSNFKEGTWAIDLDIDRHNNLSRFSNVTDTWKIPRRINAAQCFVREQISRITKHHCLAVIPNGEGGDGLRQHPHFKLYLPEDETIFRCIMIIKPAFSYDDVRYIATSDSYCDIAISDKGQNLRGIISMFGSLNQAYECLTHKFWREVIRRFYIVKEDTTEERSENIETEKMK